MPVVHKILLYNLFYMSFNLFFKKNLWTDAYRKLMKKLI